MGWVGCGDHFTKWDSESHEINGEEWISVGPCATCGAPRHWEVYDVPEWDEYLPTKPKRIERHLPNNRNVPP